MDETDARIVALEVTPEQTGYLQEHLPGQFSLLPDTIQDTAPAQYAEAEILSVFVHSRVLPAQLDRMPKLRLISTRSTGYDHLALDACVDRGIHVSNVPRYGENTVAEHTFGLILSLSRKIHKAYQRTVAGDFSLQGLEGFDLKGKTLGVIGAGSIGLHVIRIAKGFGMQVIAYDAKPNPLIAEVLDFDYVKLGELLGRADIISLHAPLIPSTQHMINSETIQLIKRGALLINTARGGLIDTDALLKALDDGILSGAGLDVLEGEELIEEEERLMREPESGEKLRILIRQHILLRRPDVVITPHMAFYSREAEERILAITVDNIRAFLAGHPQNLVLPASK